MPWAPLRRCAAPGCTHRQAAVRCPEHERTSPRNHGGVPKSQRGYGADYRAIVATFVGQTCALALPGCSGLLTRDTVSGQHTDDGTLVPSCRHCNFADGRRRLGLGRDYRAPMPGRTDA